MSCFPIWPVLLGSALQRVCPRQLPVSHPRSQHPMEPSVSSSWAFTGALGKGPLSLGCHVPRFERGFLLSRPPSNVHLSSRGPGIPHSPHLCPVQKEGLPPPGLTHLCLLLCAQASAPCGISAAGTVTALPCQLGSFQLPALPPSMSQGLPAAPTARGRQPWSLQNTPWIRAVPGVQRRAHGRAPHKAAQPGVPVGPGASICGKL